MLLYPLHIRISYMKAFLKIEKNGSCFPIIFGDTIWQKPAELTLWALSNTPLSIRLLPWLPLLKRPNRKIIQSHHSILDAFASVQGGLTCGIKSSKFRTFCALETEGRMPILKFPDFEFSWLNYTSLKEEHQGQGI